MRLSFFPQTWQLENHGKNYSRDSNYDLFLSFSPRVSLRRRGNSVQSMTSGFPWIPLMNPQILWFIPWRRNTRELPGSACRLRLADCTSPNSCIARGSSVPRENPCFHNRTLSKREQSTTPAWYWAIQCMFFKSITSTNNSNRLNVKFNVFKSKALWETFRIEKY